MPALPKPAGVRQRRNRSTTAATIKADPNITGPDLPFEAHSLTASWWADIWSSPMAPEYDDSDRHGLVMLAVLVDAFWTADSVDAKLKLTAEIRQQSQRFGLSPIDRRRLQWEIERTEAAKATGARRRAATAKSAKPPADPRSILHVV